MATDALYEQDFVVWTERQAEALRHAARTGSNLPVDWENVAEEIESVGSEALHRIESLARQIVIHLLKLACSPAIDPRAGWIDEVDEWRDQLQDRLSTNHAIRARFAGIVDAKFAGGVARVEREFRRHGEESALPALAAWRLRGISAAEVLEHGLYPEPGTLTFRAEGP